jgi:hypothetical protein
MKQHIIKRNLSINGGDESILKKGLQWYVQDKIGSSPDGFKQANIGDEVFLYETTSKVIWGKGIIKKKTGLITLTNIIELIEYSQGLSDISTNLKNDAYWGGHVLFKKPLVEKIKSSKPFEIKVFEAQIDQVPLDEPIAIAQINKIKSQSSWVTLDENESFEKIQITDKFLNEQITPNLRFKIQQKFQLISKDFVYDIDHFVPKSVGGPGNIEENLIPLHFSVNRNKSDAIPSGLFQIASQIEEITSKIKNSYLSKKYYDQTQYFKEIEAKTVAKQITAIVNKWELDKAKSFYLAVRDFHHKSYSLI